ncbi:MAG: hypothetical protein JNK64_38240 [Myxococcales bacterium]|nr:hypothetical protein [Myxococcales bacterium]
MSLRSLSSVVRFAPAVLAVALVAPAHADVSKKVIAACKGKMIISTAPIDGSDEKGTIAACKQKGGIKLQGSQNGNDVQEWTFNYTAFLSKTGGSSLKLEFYDGDKYSADRTLTGIDPKDPVLEGDITIDEDEGLTKGKTYTLKLVGKVKGKEATISSAVVTMN